MFEKFSSSARDVIFRAVDHAGSDGSSRIEPEHLLRAVAQLHPELLQSGAGTPACRVETRLDAFRTPSESAPTHGVPGETKIGFSKRSKQILRNAYAAARAQYREQLTLADRPSPLLHWLLWFHHWEVEPRHILAASAGHVVPRPNR